MIIYQIWFNCHRLHYFCWRTYNSDTIRELRLVWILWLFQLKLFSKTWRLNRFRMCINEPKLISQCVIIRMSIGYICIKKKDYCFFFCEIPWRQCLGLIPPWSSFTSCSEDVNVELTVWAAPLQHRVLIVCVSYTVTFPPLPAPLLCKFIRNLLA